MWEQQGRQLPGVCPRMGVGEWVCAASGFDKSHYTHSKSLEVAVQLEGVLGPCTNSKDPINSTFLFLKKSLFLREKAHAHACQWGRGRERETQNRKQAPGRDSPTARFCPEPKLDAQPTEPPRGLDKQRFLKKPSIRSEDEVLVSHTQSSRGRPPHVVAVVPVYEALSGSTALHYAL